MRFKPQAKDALELNLTPLIDVVFLLLIFFMVSTTFIKQGKLSISLPEARQNTLQQDKQTIDLIIDSAGNYTLHGQPLINNQRSSLVRALKQHITKNKLAGQNPALIISGDLKAPHQSLVRAMDAAAELGLSNIRISVKRD